MAKHFLKEQQCQGIKHVYHIFTSMCVTWLCFFQFGISLFLCILVCPLWAQNWQ